MSAVDFLDQWFETDVLKATMSASGIIGTFLGVRSPGTAYVLLHHYMGEIDGAFRSWGLSRAAPARCRMRSPQRRANSAPRSAPKRR
jgi:phytoene dehydrogenase-like protein